MKEDNKNNNSLGEIGSGCMWAMVASVSVFVIIPVFVVMGDVFRKYDVMGGPVWTRKN